MRKTNLLKGLVCGLMLTTVLGSVAYAKTASGSSNVGRGNEKVIFYGDNGAYAMDLRSDALLLQTCSQKYNKLCTLTASKVSYTGNKVEKSVVKSRVLNQYDELKVGITRVSNDPFSGYRGNAITYNSSSSVTGVMDDFTYTFYQVTE